jgi:hypothetical protein
MMTSYQLTAPTAGAAPSQNWRRPRGTQASCRHHQAAANSASIAARLSQRAAATHADLPFFSLKIAGVKWSRIRDPWKFASFISQPSNEDRPSRLMGEIHQSLLGAGCRAEAHSEGKGGAHGLGHFWPGSLGVLIFWPKGWIEPISSGFYFNF